MGSGVGDEGQPRRLAPPVRGVGRPRDRRTAAVAATGVDDRRSHTLAGAQVTLDRLAAAAEAGPSEG